MCLCMSVCMHTQYACECVCVCVRERESECVYEHVCVCGCVCACTRNMHVSVCLCVCVCVHVCEILWVIIDCTVPCRSPGGLQTPKMSSQKSRSRQNPSAPR